MFTPLLTPQNLNITPSQPVHFIGIGGIGMSGLAKILLETGIPVSGSDLGTNENTRALQAMGAQIFQGHDAAYLPQNALVVVSTAIDEANPEIQKARQLGLGIFHRSHLLREILQGDTIGHQTTVGITGTHGKTTLTGMTGLALAGAGLDPTVIAGGLLPGLGTNAVRGAGQRLAVAELDESDKSILQYTPTHSCITNLELDHAEHFAGGLEEIVSIFQRFLKALPAESRVYFNIDCPLTRTLIADLPQTATGIAISPEATSGNINKLAEHYGLGEVHQHAPGRYAAMVLKNGRPLGSLSLSLPGRHNLSNALFAVAVGDQLGAAFLPMAAALNQFLGMGRRFEIVGDSAGILRIDDYAHHPTEVRATLQTARECLTGSQGRVIAVFQPHRYTRLQALWQAFLTCFDAADHLILTDVYAASEPPIPGITTQAFTQQMQHPQVDYIPLDAEFGAIRQRLATIAQPGDWILSLGAGNITHLLRGWEPT